MQERGLPRREEKRLIFTNRAADRSTEIVEVHVRRQKLVAVDVAALERVAGAECGVAVERVAIAMELVRARLQHDVDHCAAGAAPLGRQAVVHHGEFRDRIRRRIHHHAFAPPWLPFTLIPDPTMCVGSGKPPNWLLNPNTEPDGPTDCVTPGSNCTRVWMSRPTMGT